MKQTIVMMGSAAQKPIFIAAMSSPLFLPRRTGAVEVN
jgi:hypothetical protein